MIEGFNFLPETERRFARERPASTLGFGQHARKGILLLIEEMINCFADDSLVKAIVPLKEGVSTLDCCVQRFAHPFIDLEIVEEMSSPLEIDPEGTCIVSSEVGGKPCRINARILSLDKDLRLQLESMESFNSISRRRFFRIDTRIDLKLLPMEKEKGVLWSGTSLSVNLSAVGVRFSNPGSLHVGQLLGVELGFPAMRGVVARCTGKVIGFRSGGQGLLEVILDFVSMKAAEQEKIIRFCLAEQRRQIRNKVKVRQVG